MGALEPEPDPEVPESLVLPQATRLRLRDAAREQGQCSFHDVSSFVKNNKNTWLTATFYGTFIVFGASPNEQGTKLRFFMKD